MENQSSITLPETLIVGADGLVGAAMMNWGREAGIPMIGTTRRSNRLDPHHIYLDLAEDNVAKWTCPSQIANAVICAGITRMDACKRDPVASYRVNADGVFALAENLVAQDIFVIYLSSNQVFDGSVAHRSPDDQVSPVSEYGRQKAAAEQQIGRLGYHAAIIRFAKILEPANPLFMDWARTLKNQQPIRAFCDMRMAPVPLSCAVSVICGVVQHQLGGIWQVSGERDISYYEAACFEAQQLNANQDMVTPVKTSDHQPCSEPSPTHTTLNTDRVAETLGITPPNVWDTVKTTFAPH
jgi:dTDP-4-dehydrorhamnose reductase